MDFDSVLFLGLTHIRVRVVTAMDDFVFRLAMNEGVKGTGYIAEAKTGVVGL
jgi:hypothetical protein